MPTCPLSPRMQLLLVEESSLVDRTPLELHLESCPACQAALLDAAGPLSLPPPPSNTHDEPPAGFLDRLRGSSRLLAIEVIPDRGTRHDRLPPGFRPDIPGFEILKEIGRGGMGVVFTANQMGLGRLVAIKVLHPGRVTTPDGLERARRGVTALAGFSHPGAVQIHAVGRHEGLHYEVLEYVEGGSLSRRLTGQPWPHREAVALVSRLAVTVEQLHQLGVVHRDLKPANVLLTREGMPKLADFDLARKLSGEELTTSGLVLGTPGAMAPEQAAGKCDLGIAVDVWALGAILHELLTGRPPLQAATPAEWMERIQQEEPGPTGLPRDLDYICLKCLQIDPGRRYPSASQLAGDLEAFLAGRALPSRSRSVWHRMGSGARRRGWMIAVLALAAGMVAVQIGWQRDRDHLDAAERLVYQQRLDIARHYLQRGDRTAAWGALDRCRPVPGRPDRRDEQWQELWERCKPGGR